MNIFPLWGVIEHWHRLPGEMGSTVLGYIQSPAEDSSEKYGLGNPALNSRGLNRQTPDVLLNPNCCDIYVSYIWKLYFTNSWLTIGMNNSISLVHRVKYAYGKKNVNQ